jgi:hypothetical protein
MAPLWRAPIFFESVAEMPYENKVLRTEGFSCGLHRIERLMWIGQLLPVRVREAAAIALARVPV